MINRVKNTARKGFTLIEILIVVVILGILAAIVVPQFTDAAADANAAAAESTERMINSQVQLFNAEQDGYPDAADVDALFTALMATDPPYIQSAPTEPTGFDFAWDNAENLFSVAAE